MTIPHRSQTTIAAGGPSISPAALAAVLAVVIFATPVVQAQTFSVIHTFTGHADGSKPFAGVAIDRGGNLYGVTYGGGYQGNGCFGGCGVAFKMSDQGAGWLFAPLHSFQGPPDGNYPAGIVIGPDGSLFGTTYGGGTGVNNPNCILDVNGCGTVFRLQPPPTECSHFPCLWNETVLYRFTGTNGDGAGPYNGDLVFDAAGSIYGTTEVGGASGFYGTVYKVTPSQGSWMESVLYNFEGSGAQGFGNPQSGVVFDSAGNLYGTTIDENAYAYGVTYQLVPSQGGWTANVLHAFQCGADGCGPQGGLIFDAAGNMYGVTAGGGLYNGGTVYEFVPSQGWHFTTVYNFARGGAAGSHLTMDAAGNFYGTAPSGGAHGQGSVFKLTPSNGSWLLTDLYDFTGGTDGANPFGAVSIDAHGNLYGTTEAGGNPNDCLSEYGSGCGVVWEISF